MIVIVAVLAIFLTVAQQQSNTPPANSTAGQLSENAPTVVSGDTVSVYYTGSYTNGTIFNTNVGGEPFNFTVGANEVITGFNQAVIGMKLNQNKTVTIPVNEAYGPVNPAMIISVSTTTLSRQLGNKTVTNGMAVVESTTTGQQIQGIVTSVNATNATINFNSPLAGKILVFNIKIVGIKG